MLNNNKASVIKECLICRDVPSLGVYMLVYEHLSCILKQVIEISTDTKTEPMPKFAQLIAGGLAGNY